MDTSRRDISHMLLVDVFNHIALPAQLPTRQETNIQDIELALIARCFDAAKTVRDKSDQQWAVWDHVRLITQSCKALHVAHLDTTSLLSEFNSLQRGGVLLLHVREQNAGLTIRRDTTEEDDKVIFEAFEASPQSEAVLAASNALLWDFPASESSIALPFREFAEPSFQEQLARFLEQASGENIKRFAARAYKAGTTTIETRNTVEPSLITVLLTTLLECKGSRIYPPLLRKRVRDDVIWAEGAEKPWRRSPMWLILRVGLQRHFLHSLGAESGKAYYKIFCCVILSRLLEDGLNYFALEALHCLNAKLCRRIAKMETAWPHASKEFQTSYTTLMTALKGHFLKMTDMTSRRIDEQWHDFKATIRRVVPLLRPNFERGDLQYRLCNSRQRLNDVLEAYSRPSPRRKLDQNRLSDTASLPQQIDQFTTRYLGLAQNEADINEKLQTYIEQTLGAFLEPPQISVTILYALRLWKAMDESAVQLYGGLLAHYHTCISPKMLDMLQLENINDLAYIADLQEYLKKRNSDDTTSLTMFDHPSEDSFAARHYDSDLLLQKIHEGINRMAEKERKSKASEHERKSRVFEDLQHKIATNPHIYEFDDQNPNVKTHDDARCGNCYFQRCAKRVKIKLFEEPLPAKVHEAKAIIFELAGPSSLKAYRRATWRMITALMSPKPPSRHEPKQLLQDYFALDGAVDYRRVVHQILTPSEWKNRDIDGDWSGITLASNSKSWLKTHYAGVHFPVGLEEVIRPYALQTRYFDLSTQSWLEERQSHTTIAHHMHVEIPSPYDAIPCLSQPGSPPFTTNDIIASQTRLPRGLSIQECLAYQGLFSGEKRRWLDLLVELGSSNINFSNEAATSLISRLALEVGPADVDTSVTQPLRSVHTIFRYTKFCAKLLELIGARINVISANWRDYRCMDMLLTLIFRLYTLSECAKDDAYRLIERVCNVTYAWTTQIRSSIPQAKTLEARCNLTSYALSASLLCRRAIYMQHDAELSSSAHAMFLESTFVLRANLDRDPRSLPLTIRNMLIRDLRSLIQLGSKIGKSLQKCPEAMMTISKIIWPQIPTSSIAISFTPDTSWVTCIVTSVADAHMRDSVLQFHTLLGYIYVNGRPVGRLPSEQEKAIVQDLFGNENPELLPSTLEGMTHRVRFKREGHEVHLGYSQDGTMFARALYRGRLLQLIPNKVFTQGIISDLPDVLVKDCIHWLDLETGVIEIRERNQMWKKKRRDWCLNVRSGTLTNSNSWLLSLQSDLFMSIANIFKGFEYPAQILVYRRQAKLWVKMPRLNLDFFINSRGLLESPQLRSEVDPNQDLGCWYGLHSGILLRDMRNPSRRSIIVPLGRIRYKRHSMHITIEVLNEGTYGRYHINNVLGRLDCAPVPRLIYFKAQLHAYTSFLMPDCLTAKTGTEEATNILTSGQAQPWVPLTANELEHLKTIAQLTCQRDYYPPNLRCMQKVTWNANLTQQIQADCLTHLAATIIRKSRELEIFYDEQHASYESIGENHLVLRSWNRRSLFQRTTIDSVRPELLADKVYTQLNFESSSRDNSLMVVSLLQGWDKEVVRGPLPADIIKTVKAWSGIEDFQAPFERTSLNEILSLRLNQNYGSLLKLCLESKRRDQCRLQFLFGIMSFRDDIDIDMIQVLISFCMYQDIKDIPIPQWSSFEDFCGDDPPHVLFIKELVQPYCMGFPSNELSEEEIDLGVYARVKQSRQSRLQKKAHMKQLEAETNRLVDGLLAQWPCAQPIAQPILGLSTFELIDINGALDSQDLLSAWAKNYRNHELHAFLQKVQSVLIKHYVDVDQVKQNPTCNVRRTIILPSSHGYEAPTLFELLQKQGSKGGFAAHHQISCVKQAETGQNDSAAIRELEEITRKLVQSMSVIYRQYGADLLTSLEAFKSVRPISQSTVQLPNTSKMAEQIHTALQDTQERLGDIRASLEKDDNRGHWLRSAGLWPSISKVELAQSIRSFPKFGHGKFMRENIVEWCVSLTTLQRLLRIEDALCNNDESAAIQESIETGHNGWSPLDYPDWLLLELDGNVLIREEQRAMAFEMINPSSNSIYQLNMGKGKSSVIIPMVAVVLANGVNTLARVIVPRNLLNQMGQVLQARLGNLLGREVIHLPFSRRASTQKAPIDTFFNLHRRLLLRGGVMLTVPEMILSFKLSGCQRLLDQQIEEGVRLVKVQQYFDKHCRSIIDEADYSLQPRVQLIYPSGSLLALDIGHDRWTAIQITLRLVLIHLKTLRQLLPRSVEIVQRSNGFPFIHILRKDFEDELIERISDDVCNRGAVFPTIGVVEQDRLALKAFITKAKVSNEVQVRISAMFDNEPVSRKLAYLMRGLLVDRILCLALKKKWNVQYGLHTDREPMSVPYSSRCNPSDTCEWGQPDCSLILTILSFYYEGLTLQRLQGALDHLLGSDDPVPEFDLWISSAQLPTTLQDLSAINVDDANQLTELWNHLRFNMRAIDFFLNNLVFPKYAKQYANKLQLSAWDLPSPSNNFTVGFSGTENRALLPLTIRQKEIYELSHTNAEVLTYLLQRRNRKYVVAVDATGISSQHNLLRMLTDRKIPVLIDAGALVLEMANGDLVRQWLQLWPEKKAAVYFENFQPWVIFKKGESIPLVESPFADDLHECLVYIDQAATRGTDLKLPRYVTGALTLSLSQSKDSTVQAAMRLRLLSTTQSVVFFSPPEVHQSIMDTCDKEGKEIDSSDVVLWLLHNTCAGIEQLQPLYQSQGIDYCDRAQAALDCPNLLGDVLHRRQYLEVLRKQEDRTLEDMYQVRKRCRASDKAVPSNPALQIFRHKLRNLRENFQDSGLAVRGVLLHEVEIERETQVEVHVVRELQRKTHHPGLKFAGLHRDLRTFLMETGKIKANSSAYCRAIEVISRTTLGKKHKVNTAIGTSLYVSAEHVRTVRGGVADARADHFLKPCNWLLLSTRHDIAIVVSPDEVEIILRLLETVSTAPCAHLVAYAPPVTRTMLHFNNLSFFATPDLPASWRCPTQLRVELGLFAGRLYFEYAEQVEIIQHLGLKPLPNNQSELNFEAVTTAGMIGHSITSDSVPEKESTLPPVSEVKTEQPVTLAERPLVFLKEWLTMRRKGLNYDDTPMSRMCSGIALEAGDIFFAKSCDPFTFATTLTYTIGHLEDEDQSENSGSEGDEYHECLVDIVDGGEVPADENDDLEMVDIHQTDEFRVDSEGSLKLSC